MGDQEVSKPVMIAIIAVVVVAIGLFGWWYLRPQKYPGFQAPPGNPGAAGPGAPRMIPGQEPGTVYPQQGGPR